MSEYAWIRGRRCQYEARWYTRGHMLAYLVEEENTVHRVSEHLPRPLWRLPNEARHESESGAVMLFELCRWHYTELVQQPCDNLGDRRLACACISQEEHVAGFHLRFDPN